ncbi:MAG: DUF1570 domain-containing protein, partial [Phycisphaerae bacterium]|nr:DUF1570 domain-containing protein [Phycisphaerae bacterium]
NSSGIFIGHKNTLASFGAEDRLEHILTVLRHEGFHQFAATFIGRQIPIWLNEGMAVFFENSEWVGGVLKIGLVPVGRLRGLKQARAGGRFIRLSKMLLMSDRDWSDNVRTGADREGLQYAEAWSMVHFLVYGDKGRYRRRLESYIRKVADGKTGERAFREVFAGDVKGFEKRWLAYIDGLKPADYIKCRFKLMVLVQLLDATLPLKDIQAFYDAAIAQKLGKWSFLSPDVPEIRSDDIKAVKNLFRCPNDRQAAKPYSYELERKGKSTDIICRHHHGLIYRATLAKNEKSGRMEPRILTLPAESGKTAARKTRKR